MRHHRDNVELLIAKSETDDLGELLSDIHAKQNI